MKRNERWNIRYFFFRQKTANECYACLVGSEMSIRDSVNKVKSVMSMKSSQSGQWSQVSQVNEVKSVKSMQSSQRQILRKFIKIGIDGLAIRDYGLKLWESGARRPRMPINTPPSPIDVIFGLKVAKNLGNPRNRKNHVFFRVFSCISTWISYWTPDIPPQGGC